MNRTTQESVQLDEVFGAAMASVCVGRIVYITEVGDVFVDFVDNPMGMLKARLVVDGWERVERAEYEGLPVLLAFENGDPSLPVIIGLIQEKLGKPVQQEEVALPSERVSALLPDGKKLVIDAKDELTLCCGKASIVLKRDGRIIIRGTHIVSRSSGHNKVKGASVAIN